MTGKKRPVIAVDGPSGVGKSTTSSLLARRLGLDYVDTGAMYRAVAVAAADAAVDIDDDAALEAFCEGLDITYDGRSGKTFVNGEDFSSRIREHHVGELASKTSARAPVRRMLTALFRRIASGGGVVMEGRDIGTVVLPHADFKFFLTADPAERARRRHAEMAGKDAAPDLDSVRAAIMERDARDASRADAPLLKADDAVLLDTTAIDAEAVVAKMIEVIEKGRPSWR